MYNRHVTRLLCIKVLFIPRRWSRCQIIIVKQILMWHAHNAKLSSSEVASRRASGCKTLAPVSPSLRVEIVQPLTLDIAFPLVKFLCDFSSSVHRFRVICICSYSGNDIIAIFDPLNVKQPRYDRFSYYNRQNSTKYTIFDRFR